MKVQTAGRFRWAAILLLAMVASCVAMPATAAWAKTSTTLSLSTSSKTPDYDAQVKLTATLKTSGGTAIKNTTVTIERWDGAGWVKLKSGKTSSSGRLTTWRTPYNHALTQYRARFGGSSKYLASTSSTIAVKPHVYLTRPDGPDTWAVGEPFDAIGDLKPAHPVGSGAVIVKRYWGDSKDGPWTFSAEFVGYVSAATGGSTYTASVVIPDDSHLYWRFVSYHADELHAGTVSPETIYHINP